MNAKLKMMEQSFDKYLDVFNNPAGSGENFVSPNVNVGTVGNIGDNGRNKTNKDELLKLNEQHQLDMTGKTKFAMIDELDKFVGYSRQDLLNNKDKIMENSLNYTKRYND